MSQNIIENKVAYLRATKDAIKDAIVEKGVEVKPEDTFRSYADKISAISAGGGGSFETDWGSLAPAEVIKAQYINIFAEEGTNSDNVSQTDFLLREIEVFGSDNQRFTSYATEVQYLSSSQQYYTTKRLTDLNGNMGETFYFSNNKSLPSCKINLLKVCDIYKIVISIEIRNTSASILKNFKIEVSEDGKNWTVFQLNEICDFNKWSRYNGYLDQRKKAFHYTKESVGERTEVSFLKTFGQNGEIEEYKGIEGQVVVDTKNKYLRVMDGVSPGGKPVDTLIKTIRTSSSYTSRWYECEIYSNGTMCQKGFYYTTTSTSGVRYIKYPFRFSKLLRLNSCISAGETSYSHSTSYHAIPVWLSGPPTINTDAYTRYATLRLNLPTSNSGGFYWEAWGTWDENTDFDSAPYDKITNIFQDVPWSLLTTAPTTLEVIENTSYAVEEEPVITNEEKIEDLEENIKNLERKINSLTLLLNRRGR